MRTSRFAITTCTALLGLGTLMISQAGPASAGNGPVIKAAPTTTTTVKPFQAEPAGYCDLHLCLEAGPVDPQPDPPFDPDLPIAQPTGEDTCPGPVANCDVKAPPKVDDPTPGCPDFLANCDEIAQPDPGCNVTHGCPGEDQPCSSEDDARTNCDGGGTTGGTDGDRPGGTDGETPGGTDGGTTGGGGRLPHTGADVATYGLAGLGFVGFGAALKRMARKAS